MGSGKALFLEGIITSSDQCSSQDEPHGFHQVLRSYKMDWKTVVWYNGMRCGVKFWNIHEVGTMPNAGHSLLIKAPYCRLASCCLLLKLVKGFSKLGAVRYDKNLIVITLYIVHVTEVACHLGTSSCLGWSFSCLEPLGSVSPSLNMLVFTFCLQPCGGV